MRIFKLSLFKGRYQRLCDERDVGFFINLGFADYMRAEEVNDFSQLVSYNPSTIIGENRFLCSSMYIFDAVDDTSPFNDDKCDMPLLVPELYPSKMFLVCPIKLQLPATDAKNVVELYNKVKEKISTAIVKNNKIDYYIYACSGASDLVLIAVSDSIALLHAVPWHLRNIYANGKALFSSVYSLFVFHKDFNASNSPQKPFSAQIQVGLKSGISNYKPMIEALESTINQYQGSNGKPLVAYQTGSGDYDLQISLSNVSLSALLAVYGIGTGLPDRETEWEKWSKDYLKYTNTFLQSDIGTLDLRASDDEKDEYPDSNYEKISTELLLKIEFLLNEIDEFIPLPSKHVISVLIDACRCLLENGFQFATGFRISCILFYVFSIIYEKHSLLTDDAINFCLRDICLAVNMALQSDSIQFDFIENDNVDSFSPTSKFLFSYESILQEAEKNIRASVSENYENVGELSEILMFFAIGRSQKIESRFYFRTEASSLPKLVSVNLPNIQYYEFVFPYIFHELGHYVPIPVNERIKRNACYFQMIKDYHILYIYHTLDTRFQGALDIAAVSEMVNAFWSLVPMPEDNGMVFDEFIALVVEQTMQNTRIFASSFVGHDDSISEIILSALRSLSDDRGYADLLDHVFREARADLVMLRSTGLDSAGYLKALFREFDGNLKTQGSPFIYKAFSIENDIDFQFRVAAVLLAVEDNISIDLEAGEKTFFQCVYNTIDEKSEYIRPLVEYLKFTNASMLTLKCVDKFNASAELSEKISYLMEHWYKNTLYWSEKANDIIKSS